MANALSDSKAPYQLSDVIIRKYTQSDEVNFTKLFVDYRTEAALRDTLGVIKNEPEVFHEEASEYIALIGEAKSEILLSELGGQIIGFVILSIKPIYQVLKESDYTGELQGEINELFVAPDYRRGGVGRILTQAAESFCQEKNCWFITLNVHFFNDSAVQFYKTTGYEPRRMNLLKVIKKAPPGD